MAKILKKLIVFTIIVIVLLSCSGCGKNKNADSGYADTSTDVAVIFGCGANRGENLVPDALNHYKVRKVLETVAEYGGSVTYVVNESKPEVKSSTIEKIGAGYTGGQISTIVQKRTDALVKTALSLKATSPETNLLKCIKNASVYLNSGNGEQKILIIADNALMQTDGLLNFSEIDFNSTDDEALLSYLEKEYVFSDYIDLSGIYTEWVGFTSTSTPQSEITPEMNQLLKRFWSGVFKNANAKDINILASADTAKTSPLSNLPAVSIVNIPELSSEHYFYARMDEEKLYFLPDSTEFSDIDATTKVLEPYIEFLQEHKNIKIVVAGMTATTSDKVACRNFSLERAEKMKHLFVQNNIDAQRITAAGLGCYDSPFRVQDTDGNGALIESLAQQNRAIIIADVESSDGKILMQYAQ